MNSAMLRFCLTLLVLVIISEAKITFHERLHDLFEKVKGNATLLQMYREHERQYTDARERYMLHRNRTGRELPKFSCSQNHVPSSNMPTSVHRLRPEHIGVIAAMGDSLTAGNGILGNNIFDCLIEYRGRSWSIGGDKSFEDGVETLPNILKKYNSKIQGYSLGKCNEHDYACSQLNVAVAGQTSQDIPAQAHELVSRLHNQKFGVDLMNQWKVVTLFIGGNDLCAYCGDPINHSPRSYISKIREGLDILHKDLPKTFVNLVEIFDITPLAKVARGVICNIFTFSVCGCAWNPFNDDMLHAVSHEYQYELEKLISTNRYDTRDDFTVVLQPFFRDTEPAKDHGTGDYDLAYFAPDCFHFSELGTNAVAKSLWNNMLDPVGNKQTFWYLNETVQCPETMGSGYFRTSKN